MKTAGVSIHLELSHEAVNPTLEEYLHYLQAFVQEESQFSLESLSRMDTARLSQVNAIFSYWNFLLFKTTLNCFFSSSSPFFLFLLFFRFI